MAEHTALSAALPDYEIGGELGRGGFGVVVAGRHVQLKREVAIKELPAALAQDASVRARFATEARVLASLSHPHIVPIYDYVERDGLCLLVMEYLPGGTVWSRFKDHGFGMETTCAVVMAVCAGLHYAHQRGVLHRDVKPENLLFNADKVLKITDFGIAKVVGGGETLATRGGDILGTPAYMAPEQAEGRELGPAADVYATGVMLYELLSGHLPFSEDGGPLAIVYRHVYEDPTPLLDVAPNVLPALAAVTMRALARSAADRYPTAEAFGVAIGEAVTPAWGVDWLHRSELQIIDPGPISESAKRPSGPGAGAAPGGSAPMGPAAARSADPGTVQVPPPTSGTSTRRPSPPSDRPAPPPPAEDETRRVAAGAPVPAPGFAHAAAPAPGRASGHRVRPKHDEHVVGGAENAVDAEYVPLRQVIELPGRPLPQILAAFALLIVALAVGFLGVGSTERTRTLAEGIATVGGVDVGRDGAVELDLSKPLEIRLSQLPAEAPSANRAQLGLSVAGVAVPASTTESLAPTDTGGLGATVEANTARYVVAGESTAELRLLADNEVVFRHQFAATPKQSPFLTIPGVLAVALLLFVLAYVESLLRPLRRGRRQVTGIVGMILLGAALGLVITAIAWVLGGAEPTVATAVVSMTFAAAAGVCAALAAIRVGKRARIKPRKAAEERAAASGRAAA